MQCLRAGTGERLLLLRFWFPPFANPNLSTENLCNTWMQTARRAAGQPGFVSPLRRSRLFQRWHPSPCRRTHCPALPAGGAAAPAIRAGRLLRALLPGTAPCPPASRSARHSLTRAGSALEVKLFMLRENLECGYASLFLCCWLLANSDACSWLFDGRRETPNVIRIELFINSGRVIALQIHWAMGCLQ